MTTTQNLHLPQWEASDRIQMDDFNDAFDKIDAGMAGAGAQIDFGTYVGDGAESRKIELRFTPKAVLVLHDSASNTGNFIYGGIALAERPHYAVNKWKYSFYIDHDYGPAIEITTGGFMVAKKEYSVNGQGFYAYTNINEERYRYIAIA